MKNCFFFLIACLLFLLSGCKAKTICVPVENQKIMHKDKIFRDSIYLQDSIVVKLQEDTVFVEKYKYLYRDRLLYDSVFVRDSIEVPYPVEQFIEVNRLSSFQSFQLWCGRILLFFAFVYFGFNILKRYF